MRKCPHLLELNAVTFLNKINSEHHKHYTISTIPDSIWKSFGQQGFDLIWLMGVWTRSPKARELALQYDSLKEAYDHVLPDWNKEDITGSPYSVFNYQLDSRLGSASELTKLKKKLNAIGLGLILDFVPNHLALDHPWTIKYPQRFVQGKPESLKAHPDWFFQTPKGTWLAHGRDPYFSPWTDTVQVNFFSKEMRKAMIKVVCDLAKICDGVRCDMAMLGLNEIFKRVWGDYVEDECSQTEFWAELIPQVRKVNSKFIFMAEVYWDLEWKLQQMGFDFTYDKRLYDRMLRSNADDVRGHLRADLAFQNHSVRFIENHDEERAISAFGLEKSKAAAAIIATIPGLRFFHEGQIEGRKIHLPIQLGREALEDDNYDMEGFYKTLLNFAHEALVHEGQWNLIETSEPGKSSNVLAWTWKLQKKQAVVVVNFSNQAAEAKLKFELAQIKNKLCFRDIMSDWHRHYKSSDFISLGCVLSLQPWQVSLIQIS